MVCSIILVSIKIDHNTGFLSGFLAVNNTALYLQIDESFYMVKLIFDNLLVNRMHQTGIAFCISALTLLFMNNVHSKCRNDMFQFFIAQLYQIQKLIRLSNNIFGLFAPQ